jgi:formate dehydrogenase iron-sulfur subunit
MMFGERDKMLELAKKRVGELKKSYPKAAALNADDVRVIFIVKDDPKKYYQYAAGK